MAGFKMTLAELRTAQQQTAAEAPTTFPEGVYDATLIKQESGTNEKGNDYVRWTFKTESVPEGVSNAFLGKWVSDSIYLTDKTGWRVNLMFAGFQLPDKLPNDIDNKVIMNTISPAFVNQRVKIQVKHNKQEKAVLNELTGQEETREQVYVNIHRTYPYVPEGEFSDSEELNMNFDA